MLRCDAQLNLQDNQFGFHCQYTFFCEKEKGHDGLHSATTKGWTEIYNKRNQIVVISWYERKE